MRKLCLSVGIGVLAWMSFEAFAFLGFIYPRFKFKSVPQIMKSSVMRPSIVKEGCDWKNELFPHPSFGYVWKKMPQCVYKENIHSGFAGTHDLPTAKDPTVFSILLTGGSVAETLGFNFLEDYLNANFIPPKGKRFLVFGGAVSGGAWPQALNVLATMHSRFDAVILLDGFNDAAYSVPPQMFGTPPFNLFSTAIENHLSVRGPWAQLAALTNQLLHAPLCEYSFVVLTLHLGAAEKVQSEEFVQFSQDFGSLHRFADGLKYEDMLRENAKLFADAARQFDAFARASNLKVVHFLQPYSHYGKKLTVEEKLAANEKAFEPRYYALMSSEFRNAIANGVRGKDLTGVFEKESRSVYTDQVHFSAERNSLGYRLLLESMDPALEQYLAITRRSSKSKSKI